MYKELFITTSDQIILIFASTIAIFLIVITYTRIAGLRSFSKMSSFDFAMTVAVGSLIATVGLAQVSLVEGIAALTALYALQVTIALLRRFSLFKKAVDNRPLLLVVNGVLLEENMHNARLTIDDINAKLREKGVSRFDQVRAVVMETTGDLSVLTGEDKIDNSLFSDVVGAERLTQ